MALSDILSNVGQGLKKGAEVAGTVIGDVADPEAAQQRQQDQNAREDQVINAKAGLLQQQLATGRKYGTITPEQEQDLSNQIIGLYNQPRHAPILMDRLRQIIHPNGAVAQGPMSETLGLPAGLSTTPPGGTVAFEAQQKALARPARAPNAKYQALDTYTNQNFQVPFSDATAEQQEAALEHFQTATTKQIGTKIVQDKTSPTGFSYGTYNLVHGGDAISLIPGAPAPRTGTEFDVASVSTDQYGNKTTTIRKTTPHPFGVNPGEIPTTPPGASPPPVLQPTLQPTAPPAVETPKAGAKAPAAKSVAAALSPPAAATPRAAVPEAAKKPLDPTGHIPDTDPANPQVKEFANQLLDDRDVDKIPAKAKAPAAALARQYGWEQGKFTPKEQTMLKEASTFLNDAINDPSILKVLDADPATRARLAQLVANPDKAGFIGRALTSALAQGMSPAEARFIQWYNQSVGTISGLAQLVRSGRATEATIERLKAELPNPITTKDSADAKARLTRLNRELGIALDKGQFSANTPEGAAQPTGGYQPGQVVIMKDGTRRRITGPRGENGKYPSEPVK